MRSTDSYRLMIRGLYCVICLCLMLSTYAAQSRSLFELDPAKQPVTLGDWGEYWIDDNSQRGPEQVDVSTALAWLPTPEDGLYPLKPGQTLWIRLTVPPAPDAESWVLEIPYPAVDRASLYTKDRLGQFTEQRAGDLTAVSQWQTPHRHPLFTVAFNAEEPTQYLLRLENAQGFSAPLRFVSSRYLLRSEQLVSMFLGVYFGVAALGFMVGLIGLAWLRDWTYLYYATCSALVGLTVAALTGVAGLYFWPNAPDWADRSLAVLGTFTLISFVFLSASVVSLAERSKRLNALVWMVALAGLGLALSLASTDSALRLQLFVPYLVLVVAVILSINLWAWRHGDRFGGWLLLCATPFAVAWGISVARYLQWIPLSFVTEHIGLASVVLELPALLTVLILRSQQRRENRRRILGLDRTDPATGLINEPTFSERLLRMNARSERLKHHGAVVLIDVTNTDQTQRDFGRKAADELMLRVAARLLSTVRDIDSAARLSDRRFGILVEGPVSAEEAATLGPRVIARCLMPFKGLRSDCIAQVRVAYALVPHKGLGNQSLMSRLDERLTTAALADDRRAVFTV